MEPLTKFLTWLTHGTQNFEGGTWILRLFSQIIAPILLVTVGLSVFHNTSVACDGDPSLRVLQTCRLHGYSHLSHTSDLAPCAGDGTFVGKSGRVPADQEGLIPLLLLILCLHLLPSLIWSWVYRHLKTRLTGKYFFKSFREAFIKKELLKIP